MKVKTQNKFAELHGEKEDEGKDKIVNLPSKVSVEIAQKKKPVTVYKKDYFVHPRLRRSGLVVQSRKFDWVPRSFKLVKLA